jgi:hypothetical protein
MWKIQPQWVVTPGKQTNNKLSIMLTISYKKKILEEYDRQKNWVTAKAGINLKLRPNFKKCINKQKDFIL